MVGKTATSLPCSATPWYRIIRRLAARHGDAKQVWSWVEEGSARQDGCAGRAGMKWGKFPTWFTLDPTVAAARRSPNGWPLHDAATAIKLMLQNG